MQPLRPLRVGVIAPSSKVPAVELRLGIERIQQEGIEVQLHPQCRKSHFFFAGTDAERAAAFFQFASDQKLSALWCARGGHGVIRVLPLLEQLVRRKGIPPRKLLLAYSDSTALMDYVRQNWGWATLHAPMPALRKFSVLPVEDWLALSGWIYGEPVSPPWQNRKLQFWSKPPRKTVRAPMIGGNLTVLSCFLGTRFEIQPQGQMLFLEDVDEALYRVDRMMQRLCLSEAFYQIKAIVLGNFQNCKDGVPRVLKRHPLALKSPDAPGRLAAALQNPPEQALVPLRRTMSEQEGLKKIFWDVAQQLRVPVAWGLPVGHGPEVSPLPLGAEYELTPLGRLRLLNWDWLQQKSISNRQTR